MARLDTTTRPEAAVLQRHSQAVQISHAGISVVKFERDFWVVPVSFKSMNLLFYCHVDYYICRGARLLVVHLNNCSVER